MRFSRMLSLAFRHAGQGPAAVRKRCFPGEWAHVKRKAGWGVIALGVKP